jgi:hypothetical protein
MNILLIAKPGGGKTTVGCQMPKPLLLIDVDSKADQMINLQPDIKSGNIVVYHMKSRLVQERLGDRALTPHKGLSKEPQGYLEIVNLLNDIMDGVKEVTDRDGQIIQLQGYKTYMLDSLSRLVEHMKRLLIYHRTKGRFGKYEENKATEDMNWPSWGSYLSNLEELMDACVKYIPNNFVCTVHEQHKTSVDPMTKAEVDHGYWPMVDGSMREKLSGYFNEVYCLEGNYTKTDGKKWFMRTAGNKYTARTSLNLKAEVDADLPKLFKDAGIYDQLYGA